MEQQFTCPVCGKVGIPDYIHNEICCPQCGADLRIFRLIEEIPDAPKKNIWKPISAVAIVAAAVLGILILIQKPKVVVDSAKVEQLTNEVNTLTQQNSELKKELETAKRTELASGFKYEVRRGDSYWGISQKMYGTGTKASEIAGNNNRTIHDKLHVGEVLVIK